MPRTSPGTGRRGPQAAPEEASSARPRDDRREGDGAPEGGPAAPRGGAHGPARGSEGLHGRSGPCKGDGRGSSDDLSAGGASSAAGSGARRAGRAPGIPRQDAADPDLYRWRMILGFAHAMEPPPPATDLLTISDEVREAIRANMADMTLSERFRFTLSFFRFAAIFLAEVGKEISKGQSPDAMALLQLSGAVTHEVGPFSVWGRGRATTARALCSGAPRPSSCPSPRPLDHALEEEEEALDEGAEDPHCLGDEAASSGEYVTVVVDDVDEEGDPGVESADAREGGVATAATPVEDTGAATADPAIAEAWEEEEVAGEEETGPQEHHEHTPGDWMRLLGGPGPEDDATAENDDDGDGVGLVQLAQMIMNPEQTSQADERFGRLLEALQLALEGSGDQARGRAQTLLHTVIRGRWTFKHSLVPGTPVSGHWKPFWGVSGSWWWQWWFIDFFLVFN